MGGAGRPGGWLVGRAEGEPAAFEAAHEIAGLRFWNGDPMVHLLDADESRSALLLERCEPGTHLRSLKTEAEQDDVIAKLLVRAWRCPDSGEVFRPLADMIDRWSGETRAQEHA